MNIVKFQDIKLTHRNPLAFLYMNNEKTERNEGNNSIHHCNEKNKILRLYLPKETKDLYTENYKTLLKEIKEDTNRWRNIQCSWTLRSV